jgi:succinyl-CoA synthetase beta subunit
LPAKDTSSWRHEKPYVAGKKTLAESGVAIITGDSMADAAQKVVKAVGK